MVLNALNGPLLYCSEPPMHVRSFELIAKCNLWICRQSPDHKPVWSCHEVLHSPRLDQRAVLRHICDVHQIPGSRVSVFKEITKLLYKDAAQQGHNFSPNTNISSPALFGYAQHQHQIQQIRAHHFAPYVMPADAPPLADAAAAPPAEPVLSKRARQKRKQAAMQERQQETPVEAALRNEQAIRAASAAARTPQQVDATAELQLKVEHAYRASNASEPWAMLKNPDGDLMFINNAVTLASGRAAKALFLSAAFGCEVHSLGKIAPPTLLNSCGFLTGSPAQPSTVEQVVQLLQWLESLHICPGHLSACFSLCPCVIIPAVSLACLCADLFARLQARLSCCLIFWGLSKLIGNFACSLCWLPHPTSY